MKQVSLLKLLGISLLTMIVLVACSFLEVAFYAYLVNPGQTQEAYEKHAQFSAPIVSCIGGFVVFFLVVRYWKRKGFNVSQLWIAYPAVYLVVDLLIIFLDGSAQWSSFIYIFLVSAGAKVLGSYLGAKLTKTPNVTV